MRTVVVYESHFGNTKSIAEAVAFGLAGDVEIFEVGDAPTEFGPDVGLLVVGGPTHAFGLSRPGTRRSVGALSEEIGVREWLNRLSLTDVTATAVFCTRVFRPRLPGSAARAMARRLHRMGVPVIVPPVDFFVRGTDGPLLKTERERAIRWGTGLGKLVRPVLELQDATLPEYM